MTAIETRQSGVDFIFVFAKIFNQAGAAARLAGNTGITPMQDQPVMAVDLKLGGDQFQKLLFHLFNILARGELRPIADAEDVRVHGDGRPAKGGIQHHVGGFTAHAGQRLQRCSVFRHLAIVLLQQDAAGFDDVFRFAVKQADSLDIRFYPIHPRASIAAGVLATG